MLETTLKAWKFLLISQKLSWNGIKLKITCKLKVLQINRCLEKAFILKIAFKNAGKQTPKLEKYLQM